MKPEDINNRLIDREAPRKGKGKQRRIDLGLDIAARHVPPGGMSAIQIAAFCGCSHQAINIITNRALRKIRRYAGADTLRELRDGLEDMNARGRQEGCRTGGWACR